jgi:hypothetical protein
LVPQVLAVVYLVVTGLAILFILTARGFRGVFRRFKPQPSVTWPTPAHPEIVVTLIHGTWARSAAWVLPSSPLSKALVSAWGDRIALMPFLWSGGNTLRARERAASALRQHIDAVVARYPSQLQRSCSDRNHREVDARLGRRADLKVRHDCATFRS